MKKLFTKLLLILLFTLIFIPFKVKAQESTSSIDFLDIVKELTKPDYSGRQSGTDGYEKSVAYLEELMKQLDIVPMMANNSYRQIYSLKKATLVNESFKINNKSYEIMRDYMPFSQCTSGKFSFSNLSYVAEGREDNYIINTDGVVILNWYDENGKFPEGMLDRVIRAKNHGAKAVLIILDGELKVGNYEHPLNGDDIGIPVIYVSPQLAQNVLGVINDYVPKILSSKNIDIDLNIKREDSYSYNLLGLIKGKAPNKSILITTNLDGFGSLPDGKYFESAKSGAVTPAMLLELAQYYKYNKPDYNVIIAFAGSKWTGNEGIKEISKVIDFNQIVSTLDIYAMGGSGNPALFYTNSDYKAFATRVNSNVNYNSDLGNSLANVLSKKTKKVFFMRDSNTWVDDSLSDIYDNVSQEGYKKGLNYIKYLVGNVISNDEEDENFAFNYDSNNIKTIYEKDADTNMKFLESKYFKIYFDDEFKQYLDIDYLKEIDRIYERIAKFNYYPHMVEKVKLLNISDGSKAAKIANRTDLVNNPERAGGGFASFDRPVIYCKQPSLGTVSHELNHLLANYKGYGKGNSMLQECQGQSFLVYYYGKKYVEDASELINNNLNSWEAPKVIENAKNYKQTLDWKIYTANKADPDGWQNSYRILGSMYSYIKYTFGEDAARRAIYRNYDSIKDIQHNLVSDIDVNIDTFLEGWSLWMISSGKDISKNISAAIKDYKDDLTTYDYQKIYLIYNQNNSSNISDDNGSNIGHTENFDGNIYFNSDYSNGGFKVNSFKAERNGSNVEFTLNYESSRNCDYSFFNPPNGDKLMEIVNEGIKQGTNTTKFSLNMDKFNKVLSVDSIAMRFGFDDNPNWISFNTSQLKSLLNSSSSNTKSVNDNDFVLLKQINNVDLNKDWIIDFTGSIDEKSLDNTKIFVLDENNKIVNVNLSLNNNNDKEVIVKHINSYESKKTYKLYITKDVKSKKSKDLSRGVLFKFTIQ